jgi:hypothetical protein
MGLMVSFLGMGNREIDAKAREALVQLFLEALKDIERQVRC